MVTSLSRFHSKFHWFLNDYTSAVGSHFISFKSYKRKTIPLEHYVLVTAAFVVFSACLTKPSLSDRLCSFHRHFSPLFPFPLSRTHTNITINKRQSIKQIGDVATLVGGVNNRGAHCSRIKACLSIGRVSRRDGILFLPSAERSLCLFRN